MRKLFPLLLLATAIVSGCGSSASHASVVHTATPTGTPAQPTPVKHASAGPTATVTVLAIKPTSIPTVVLGTTYARFLHQICGALSAGDATTISNALPFYQYNSGLRYGNLGDGEGQSGDPALLTTWLQGATTRCTKYTPDVAGHATVLTTGWKQSGGWSLIEMDTYNGVWKINDFTFGSKHPLVQAMKTSHPILTYHA
ncbi:MAG: hypothetical protein ACRDFX_08680 [Chloroflexota bacterium]